ncbi:MAG TPA: cell division protein SepF [Pseudonocardiaceae bacterium]
MSWEQLSLALDDAVALCPFDAGIAGPDVYLSGMVRLTPTSYMDAVHEVSRHFSDGRSVSIDFGRLEGRQAVRLIDFSMGLAAGGSGWILRVAESVLVLTPFRR